MAMEIFRLMGTVAISKDQALKDIKAIQTQAEKTSTAMGKSFTKFSGYVEKHSAQIKKAGKYLTVFGGIATAAFALSVKSAANFETQLANVSTMLDESAMKILPEYRKGLQSLSVDFGESTETLSKGLYDILSASIPPAEALGVLEISAKAAAAGITDTGVAADAITTILNSYGMSADQAGTVSDKLFAIVKRGKCVRGDTRVLLSDGRYERIDTLVEGGEVISWDYRNFVPAKAIFRDMGEKETIWVKTCLGREICTTPEHPYLTPEGWKRVDELKEKDRIAVPTSLPVFGNSIPDEGWPELLGYLISEGSIIKGSPDISTYSKEFGVEIKRAANKLKCMAREKRKNGKIVGYRIVAGDRGNNYNPVIERLRDNNLWGRGSREKFIPSEVFIWKREYISLFLKALFNGDGWLCKSRHKKNVQFQLGYASSSKRLIEDVSHLLLRFGIVGHIRKKSNNAWAWQTRRYAEIKRFTDFIGIGRETATSKEFLEYKPVGYSKGRIQNLVNYGGKPRRKKEFNPFPSLRNYSSPIFFDQIAKIKKNKKEKVYDLSVPILFNFVANDILAHNTTFSELAPSIGKVAATASMSGLSFDDLGASIATITRAGIRSEEAMTAINGVLRAFLSPTTEGIEAAKGFGLELSTTTLKTEGLTGVMDKLKDATAEQLAAIFPNIRGLKGMAAALGDAEGYARDYALMLDSAGLTQEAFAKQSATLNFKIGQLKEMFNVIKTTIGTALIPAVEDLAKKAMDVLKKVKEWTEANKEHTESLVKWGAASGVAALALGPLLIALPGLVLAFGGLGKVIGGVVLAEKQMAMTTAAINGLNFTSAGVIGKLTLMQFGLQAVIVGTAVAVVKLIDAAYQYYNVTLPALNRAQQLHIDSQQRLATALGVSLEQYQEWSAAGVGITDMMGRAGVTLQEFKNNLAGVDVSILSQELNITAERLWEVVESGEPIADLLERIGVKFSDLSGIASIAAGNLDKVSTAFRDLKASTEVIEPIKDVFMLVSLNIAETEGKIKSLTQEMTELKNRGFSTEEISEYQTKLDGLNEQLEKYKNLISGLTPSGEVLGEGGIFKAAETYGRAIGLVEELTENMSELEKKQAAINQYWDEAIKNLSEMGLSEEDLTERTELYIQAKEYELKLLNEEKTAYDKLVEAQKNFSTIMEGITDKIFEFTHTEYEVKLREINKEYDDLITRAKELYTDESKLAEIIETLNIARTGEIVKLDALTAKEAENASGKDKLINAYKAIKDEIFELTHTPMEVQIRKLGQQKQAYLDLGVEIGIVNKWHDAEIAKLNELNPELDKTTRKLKEAGETGAKAGETITESLTEVIGKIDLSTQALSNFTKEGVAAAIATIKMKFMPLIAQAVKDLNWAKTHFNRFWGVQQMHLDNLRKLMSGAIESVMYGYKEYQKILASMEGGAGGGVGFQFGGIVRKLGEGYQRGGGIDNVLIRATAGEYLISKPMTDFIKRTGMVTGGLVKAIQSGERTPTPGMQFGGEVGTYDQRKYNSLVIEQGAIVIQTPKFTEGDGQMLFNIIERKAKDRGLAFTRS